MDDDLNIRWNFHTYTWENKPIKLEAGLGSDGNKILLEIIKTMPIFQRLQNEEVLVNKYSIFEDIKNHISRGHYKELAIRLALKKASLLYNILCIDELENSLYYDAIHLIWQIINDYSKQYNIQLFITTHSMECIQSFVDNVSDTDIALYRLETKRVVRYDREQLCFELESKWEFR